MTFRNQANKQKAQEWQHLPEGQTTSKQTLLWYLVSLSRLVTFSSEPSEHSGLFLLNLRSLTSAGCCHHLCCCCFMVHSLKMVELHVLNYDLLSLVWCLWHSASLQHDLLLTSLLTFEHNVFLFQSWPLTFVCYILLILSVDLGSHRWKGIKRSQKCGGSCFDSTAEPLRIGTCWACKSESFPDLLILYRGLWV